ncbi:MAG: FG-GAP repeat protein [Nitrospira sp.]|nr:FG-GAP repeat protein [Nitrospira sp.]
MAGRLRAVTFQTGCAGEGSVGAGSEYSWEEAVGDSVASILSPWRVILRIVSLSNAVIRCGWSATHPRFRYARLEWCIVTATTKLLASDGAGGDQFGYSVAMAGDTVVAASYEIRNSAGTVLIGGAGDPSACVLPLTRSICPTTTGFDQVQETVAVSLAAGTLAPGVYDACVRGTDAKLNIGAYACSNVVVYDPSGRFVIGSGWIQSSPGFCTLTALCESA